MKATKQDLENEMHAGNIRQKDAAVSEKLCHYCQKVPLVKAYHPFCSTRCQDADLLNWLKGVYVIQDNPLKS